MGGGTVVLCVSSSFQVGILVSIPRVGEGANPVAFRVPTTTSVRSWLSLPEGLFWRIPSANSTTVEYR